MKKRSKEVEHLRRFARHRPEWAFRQDSPGFCTICQVQTASALKRPHDEFPSRAGPIVAVPG